jgi:hypothetical protein
VSHHVPCLAPGPLTDEQYGLIYSKVPRPAVDIIVRNEAGAVYLTRRAHGHCQGRWHIPGEAAPP